MTPFIRLISLATAATLISPGPLHLVFAGDEAATGVIVGRVVEECSGRPIQNAFVTVSGANPKAFTNRDGYYRLERVPSGTHQIHVSDQPLDATATVRVVPDDSTQCDFVLRPEWTQSVPAKPSLSAGNCPIHGTEMRWILTPISYGLRVVDPNYKPSYAWCGEDGGCVVSSRSPKVSWRPSCAECVRELNQVRSAARWDVLPNSVPANWERHAIPGIIQFQTPPGLQPVVFADTCGVYGAWESADAEITLIRASLFERDPGDYSVYDAVGDSQAAVAVLSAVNTYQLTVGLRATPSSIESKILSVKAYGPDAATIARTILASVRFDRNR